MKREIDAIIFAAGQATRLKELGAAVPKVLLPVWKNEEVLEPLLARLIRQVALAGAKTIRLVVNHQKHHIEQFVARYTFRAVKNIELVYQEVLDGEAGGLFLLHAGELPMLAIDADNYLSDDYFFKRLTDCYFEDYCWAAIGVCPVADITRYANVKVSPENLLIDIVEKPKPEEASGNLAKMGCYVLSPQLIQRGRMFFLDSRGDVATTAAFSNLCGQNEAVRCVPFQGYYLDIGDLDSYAKHLTRESMAL